MSSALPTDQRILLATARIIDKTGEAGVRISDICKALNITAPSIYHFFGDREGLIEATQAHRYSRGQLEISETFAAGVYACRNKNDFVTLVHRTVRFSLSADRISVRRAHTEVLGSAQYRPSLARKLAQAQDELSRTLAEPLRYAQAKGWMSGDVDPFMFAMWVSGNPNSRRLIELDGLHQNSSEWDFISFRAICAVLDIPEPKATSPKRPKKK